MTGKGRYSQDTDEFRLEVEVGGLVRGNLAYTVDEDGNMRVKGDHDRKIINLTE